MPALLVRAAGRRSPVTVAVASGLAVVGIFIHRLNLLLNGLSYVPIALPPGVGIGTPQTGATSFAMYHWYVPTTVEWLSVLGVLAFGALLFTVATLVLPLREHAAEAHAAR